MSWHAARPIIVMTVLLMPLCGCQKSNATADSDAAAEPNLVDGHQRMIAVLEDIAARTADENEYLGDADVRRLKDELSRLPADVHLWNTSFVTISSPRRN